MVLIPLIEDTKVSSFETEKGLSLYLETGDKKIIFDTGKSKMFSKNAKKIGINLKDIDFFVISHGHSDHFGGIHDIENENFKIYSSKISKNKFHYNILGIKKIIGDFDKSQLEIESLDFKNKYEIDENIYLVKSFQKNRSNKFLKGGETDEFNHEINLVIIENEKLNVITGCCHSGVINLIETLTVLFPDQEINSLIGGIHTRGYILRPFKLFQLIKFFENHKFKLILGHCTGNITLKLISLFLKNVRPLRVGDKILV